MGKVVSACLRVSSAKSRKDIFMKWGRWGYSNNELWRIMPSGKWRSWILIEAPWSWLHFPDDIHLQIRCSMNRGEFNFGPHSSNIVITTITTKATNFSKNNFYAVECYITQNVFTMSIYSVSEVFRYNDTLGNTQTKRRFMHCDACSRQHLLWMCV